MASAFIVLTTGVFQNLYSVSLGAGVWSIITNNTFLTGTSIVPITRIVFETGISNTAFTNNNSLQQYCNTITIPASSANAYNSTVILQLTNTTSIYANVVCNFTPAGFLSCMANMFCTKIA